jgi:peptidyl-prolyl cis-trans isomerase A (cyclophilin A)
MLIRDARRTHGRRRWPDTSGWPGVTILTCLFAGLLLAGCAADESSDRIFVTVETTLGEFVVELEPDAAPRTVENFLCLVRRGYYDGRLFYRVVPEFTIQAGAAPGETGFGETCTGEPLSEERNTRVDIDRAWVLGMVQSPGQTRPFSHFFITLRTQDVLFAQGYTGFGHVVSGTGTIRRIAEVPLAGPDSTTPVEPIVMTRVRVRGEW